jgi:hypothetical protein
MCLINFINNVRFALTFIPHSSHTQPSLLHFHSCSTRSPTRPSTRSPTRPSTRSSTRSSTRPATRPSHAHPHPPYPADKLAGGKCVKEFDNFVHVAVLGIQGQEYGLLHHVPVERSYVQFSYGFVCFRDIVVHLLRVNNNNNYTPTYTKHLAVQTLVHTHNTCTTRITQTRTARNTHTRL